MKGALPLLAAALILAAADLSSGASREAPAGNFAAEMLRQARDSLGIQETAKNTSPEIEAMGVPFGIVGPVNWCAIYIADLVRRSADALGVQMPIDGSPVAQDTMRQFKKLGQWIPGPRDGETIDPAELRPGMVPVWVRGNINDPNEWRGHIGVLESVQPSRTFEDIEGNSGPNADRVARMTRSLDDPALFGFGTWAA